MAEDDKVNLKIAAIERGLVEIKTVFQETNKSFISVKDTFEKFGLSVIERLGVFQNQFEEIQKNLKKIDTLEMTVRGLRFTTKETLEKLIERVLELEKDVKNKPNVEAIVVQEVEEPETKTKEAVRKTVKIDSTKTATENTLLDLSQAIKEQISADELIKKIAETRDNLMSWTPHHPVFYEMHEWMQKIKHLPKNKPITSNYANQLLKDINDWLKRIIA